MATERVHYGDGACALWRRPQNSKVYLRWRHGAVYPPVLLSAEKRLKCIRHFSDGGRATPSPDGYG